MAMRKDIPNIICRRRIFLSLFQSMCSFLKQISNRHMLPAKQVVPVFNPVLQFLKHKTNLFTASAFIFLLAMAPGKSFGNVSVTTLPSLTVYACGGSFPTGYYSLGNIVITEGNNGDFPNTGAVQKTLILSAPTNFQFNPVFGSTTGNGGNVVIVSTVVAAGTITITYTCAAVNKADVLTISNIQVRGTIAASGPSNILRTAANPGTGVIAGITNDVTNFGTLTSVAQTIPSVTTSTTQTSCSANSANIALTSSPSGSSFTWTLGTVTNVTGATACNSSCGTTIAQTLNVSSGNSGSVQYNVTPTLNGCAGTALTITTTVYALPSAGTVTVNRTGGKCGAKIVGNAVTCPDGSAPLYQWETRTNGGNPCSSPWTILGVTTDSSYTPADTSLATKNRFRRLVICGSCQSSSYAPDCNGTPPVSNYIILSGTGTGVCTVNEAGSGGTVTVTVNGGIAPYNYTFNSTSSGWTTNTSYTFSTGAIAAASYTASIKDSGDPPNGCNASTTVTLPILGGTNGVWTGAKGTDWFDCGNWGKGFVPRDTNAVTIAATSNNPIINLSSSYATLAAFTYAQSANITLNDTLSFAATSDKLLAKGNVTIASGGLMDMTNGGITELQGNWNDQISNGLKYGTGSVIFSGGSTQTLSAVSSPETFYNFQINKTAATNRLDLNKSVTVARNLTLTQGIITTGNNLFTWDNSGGTLTVPEPSYTANSTNYTKSFIATSDATGTPISVAGPTTPFGGTAGFQIKNVGFGINTYFPVGASFLPGATGQSPSPNRIMISNESTSADYTVVVNYGDIGYTNGTAGTWRVNRIWYVKSSDAGTGKATMRLFFTKRDWSSGQWPADENEVEAGFNYAQTALVQKDYAATERGNIINLSTGADVQDFTNFSSYPDNTEIFGLYTINVSFSLTNGIAQFNRFSVVNPGTDIILPVSLTNLKAYQKGNAIQIDWSALNELNVGRYEVEKSANGFSFAPLINIPARNNGNIQNNYSTLDTKPLQGDNFYRIKAVDKNGTVHYTAIISVNINGGKTSVTVMPNPVPNKVVDLQLNNLAAGRYNLVLYNSIGQKVFSKTIEHSGGSASQTVTFPSGTPKGIYVLKVFNQTFDYNTKLVIK